MHTETFDRSSRLARELACVEDEVCAISAQRLVTTESGARLVELAAREYEILSAMSHLPGQRPAPDVSMTDV